MRQLHIVPYYAPATEFGGIQTVTQQLAVGMAARGHEVTVLTTDVGSRGRRLDSLDEVIEGVRVLRVRNLVPSLVRMNLYTPFGVRARLAEIVRGADLVHTHDVFNWLTYRAIEAAAANGVTSVMSTDNGLAFKGLPSRVRARAALWRWLGPPTVARVAAVHAIHESELDCGALGIPARKMRYLSYGVPFPPPLADAARFRARHLLGDRDVVLFVGQLMSIKGVPLLLQLARRWRTRKDVVFVFVGFQHAELDEAIAAAPRDNTVFTGFLTGQALEDAYAAAAIYVLPSSVDMLPNTLLEALARGVPAVVSRHTGLDGLEHADAGRYVELDLDSLERTVQALLDRRAEWPKMASAARALVEARFSVARSLDAFERLYAELLGG
jgi:glycosyltransferase involved in cell wall biosynthesis